MKKKKKELTLGHKVAVFGTLGVVLLGLTIWVLHKKKKSK